MPDRKTLSDAAEKDFVGGATKSKTSKPTDKPTEKTTTAQNRRQKNLRNIVGKPDAPKAKTRATADLEVDLHRRLKLAAAEMGCTQSDIIIGLLEKYLPEYKD